jgi:hypothetical protein
MLYPNELLLRCDKKLGIGLQISIDVHEFSIDYLRRYAPTGLEFILPTSQKIGKYTFYIYGRGGGGVWYPDQYFTNLSGNILIILFYEPPKGGDPYWYRIMENHILFTFRINE